MRLMLMAALVPLCTSLCACHASWDHAGQAAQASGPGATRIYNATGFTSVDLQGSDNVQVRIADAFSVRAEGDPKVLDQLDIRVDGDKLKIGRKKSSSWNWGNSTSAKIFVTLPKLAAANVEGSGDIDADHADGDFSGAVSGSGNLKVADVRGGNVDLSVAGSGDMTIAGHAAKMTASSTGSGDLDARSLTATSANVSVTGSGSVKGTVNGEAAVSIVGSGDVDLGGGAHCTVNSVGSGDARCG